MIIIVEGIDRVGKTTLVNKLQKRLNLSIYKHKNTVIDYDQMDNINETDKLLQLVDVCNCCNSSIIFDRFHLSETIYGILNRNYIVHKAINNFHLVDDALANNAILILVQPTSIERSSLEHGSNLYYHNMMFNAFFDRSKIQYKFCCNYINMDKIIEEIVDGVF